MNKVFILRGVPGSGKSTFAKNKIKELDLKDDEFVIASQDDFFMKNREYHFVGANIMKAVDYCWKKFVHAIENDVQYIFVDNTNVKYWMFEKYVKFAETRGYLVEIVSLGTSGLSSLELFQRNTHGVPLETIERMIREYEE